MAENYFGGSKDQFMRLYCDNKSAIDIAHNLVQYDKIKHVEVDRHFIKEKLESDLICTPFVPIGEQLADVLTKGLPGHVYRKMGLYDIYSPS